MPRTRRDARGWTLIEALVAIALTAVLAAVVFSTWLTVHRVMQGRSSRSARAAAAAVALRRLAADLECACEPGEGTAFELRGGPGATPPLELHFFAFVAPDRDAGSRPPEVRELRYQVLRGDERDLRLVRIDRPATGPGADSAGKTNVLIERAVAFTVTVSDGTNWAPEWPPKGGNPFPAAARASLGWAGATGPATARVETVIHAGVPVKPRLERRSAPAAAP